MSTHTSRREVTFNSSQTKQDGGRVVPQEEAMRLDGCFIHETAIVEPGAVLGSGTKVWHHVHVRANGRVGDDSSLGKNVFVDAHAVIGARCRIQNNVSLYDGVVLEDDVFVGPSAVFTNDRFPRANSEHWSRLATVVGQGTSIGANATILCGTKIGEWAVVGAGAVVTRDVEPHEVVVGNPARHLGWACRCGQIVDRGDQRPETTLCQGCDRGPEDSVR